MSFEAPGAALFAFPCDTDRSSLTKDLYAAVAIGPAQNVAGTGQGNSVIVPYKAGDNFIGILQNPAVKGEAGTICFRGISKCRAATAWINGDKLAVADGGALKKAGDSDTVFATAVEAAGVGDESSCLVHR